MAYAVGVLLFLLALSLLALAFWQALWLVRAANTRTARLRWLAVVLLVGLVLLAGVVALILLPFP